MSTEAEASGMSAKPAAWKSSQRERKWLSTDRQFGPQQQKEALALLETFAWGDMPMQIYDLELTLRRAIEATRSDFLKWKEEAEAVGLPDEFSVPPEVVAVMSPEWRLAYLARLLMTLAMWYGISTDLEGWLPVDELPVDELPVDEVDEHSPAALLRGLVELVES